MKLKKYIALSLMVFILFLSVPAHALYRVTDFTGGCADCLDVIDGARLKAKTKPSYAIVTTTPEHATYPDKEFTYLWDSDAACAESVPDSIIPDDNASGGCWILLTPGQAADIVDDSVKDVSIDWGTGSEQVSAVDVPIADGGGLITGIEVETALQENRTAIDVNTGLAHAESHTVASHSDTSGTGAELDTLTDTSDASGLHNHTTANLNDTTATGTELTELTDGSVTTEHDHSRIAASDGTPNNAIDCDADGDCTASGDLDVSGTLSAIGPGDIATTGSVIVDGDGTTSATKWGDAQDTFMYFSNPDGLKLSTTMSEATGNEATLNLVYTVNKASSGDAYGILLTPTETSVPANHYGIGFGNVGLAGDSAMINLTATGYDAGLIRRSGRVTCSSNVCNIGLGSFAIFVTTSAGSDGPDISTLPNGKFDAYELYIELEVDGGDDIDITPTSLINGTTITLDAAGESVTLMWNNTLTGWNIKSCFNSVVDESCSSASFLTP